MHDASINHCLSASFVDVDSNRLSKQTRTLLEISSNQISQVVEEKKKLLDSTNEKIQRRDIEIASKEGALRKKDAEITRLLKRIVELEEEIKIKGGEQENTLSIFNSRILELTTENEQKTIEIEQAQKSLQLAIKKLQSILWKNHLCSQEQIENLQIFTSNCQSLKVMDMGSRNSILSSSTNLPSQKLCILNLTLQKHLQLIESKLKFQTQRGLSLTSQLDSVRVRLSVLKDQTAQALHNEKQYKTWYEHSLSDVTRLKESLKSMESILRISEEKRFQVLRGREEELRRAMQVEGTMGDIGEGAQGAMETLEEVRESRRVIIIRVQELQRKLAELKEEYIANKVQDLRNNQEVAKTCRALTFLLNKTNTPQNNSLGRRTTTQRGNLS